MAPQILTSLETLATCTLERPSSRVYAFMQLDSGRVFERLTADAALARVVAVVAVQIVLLEVHFEFEADVADVTTVRSRDAVDRQVALECQ